MDKLESKSRQLSSRAVQRPVTFNHGVAGSSPAGLANKIKYLRQEPGGEELLGVSTGVSSRRRCPSLVNASWLDK
jgi:hypothetical protein